MGKPHTKKSPAQRNIEYTARLEKKKEKNGHPAGLPRKNGNLNFVKLNGHISISATLTQENKKM